MDKFNCGLVSVFIDGSHEVLVQQNVISFLLVPKTSYLTETFSYEKISVDANDDKYQNYQLSTNGDEKNDKNKDPIDTYKQSPSSAAQIETDIFALTATVLIAATKAPVF